MSITRHTRRRKQNKDGGDPKDLAKFIDLEQYVESHHPEFYEILKDLRVEGSLRSIKRGQGGITLIIPSDEFLKDIKKEATSGDTALAVDMAQTLILTVLCKTGEDWKRMSDDISTIGGKRLVLVKASAKEVEIESAKLTPIDISTVDRHGKRKRAGVAVWKMASKGYIDVAALSDTTRKYENVAGGNVKYVGSDEATNEATIVRFINEAIAQELSSIQKSPTQINSVLCRIVCNFVEYVMRDTTPEGRKAQIFTTFLLNTHPHIAFVLIFGCRGPTGLLDCDYLVKAISSGSLMTPADKPITTLASYFQQYGSQFFNVAALTEMKLDILDNIGVTVGYNTPKKIIAVYTTLDQTNSYGSHRNVYPQELHDRFKAVPNLHILIDQAKYYLCEQYRSVELILQTMPMNRYGEMCGFFDRVREIYTQNIRIFVDKDRPNARNVLLGISAKVSVPGSVIDDHDLALVAEMMKWLWSIPACGLKIGGDDEEDSDVVDVEIAEEYNIPDSLKEIFSDADTTLKEAAALMRKIKDKYPEMELEKAIIMMDKYLES